MIANQTTHPNLREEFIEAVKEIFDDTGVDFLDYIEDQNYGKSADKYDTFCSSDGENYIINRYTGEYINWYKFTHIGRCIHVSYNGVLDIRKFLQEFKDDMLTE